MPPTWGPSWGPGGPKKITKNYLGAKMSPTCFIRGPEMARLPPGAPPDPLRTHFLIKTYVEINLKRHV